MSACFYLTVILISNKKIKQKMLPKDGKIIRLVWSFLILTVWELPFCLAYCLFGSLMPVMNYLFLDFLTYSFGRKYILNNPL